MLQISSSSSSSSSFSSFSSSFYDETMDFFLFSLFKAKNEKIKYFCAGKVKKVIEMCSDEWDIFSDILSVNKKFWRQNDTSPPLLLLGIVKKKRKMDFLTHSLFIIVSCASSFESLLPLSLFL